MALVKPKQSLFSVDNVSVWTWEHLTQADDTGEELGKNFIDYVDRSVQIEGNFDGGTLVLEGSNDKTNWRALTDPQGNPISKVAPALEQITESVLYARPKLTVAGAAADITVTIAARKTKR